MRKRLLNARPGYILEFSDCSYGINMDLLTSRATGRKESGFTLFDFDSMVHGYL